MLLLLYWGFFCLFDFHLSSWEIGFIFVFGWFWPHEKNWKVFPSLLEEEIFLKPLCKIIVIYFVFGGIRQLNHLSLVCYFREFLNSCCRLFAKMCPTLCDAINYSTLGFSFLHYVLKLTQTHVHWMGDAIQPSHPLSLPFSFCPQSLPASRSFPVSQFFASGGQSIEASASTSVLPKNIQDWFPVGLTGWIFFLILKSVLQHHNSKASILQNTAIFRSRFYINTWLLEK